MDCGLFPVQILSNLEGMVMNTNEDLEFKKWFDSVYEIQNSKADGFGGALNIMFNTWRPIAEKWAYLGWKQRATQATEKPLASEEALKAAMGELEKSNGIYGGAPHVQVDLTLSRIEVLMRDCENLQAERDVLKKALEEITEKDVEDGGRHTFMSHVMADHARKAIKTYKKETL